MRLLQLTRLLQYARKGGLNPYSTGNEVVATFQKYTGLQHPTVLILILLEMRLLHTFSKLLIKRLTTCLNPYSTGNEVVAK